MITLKAVSYERKNEVHSMWNSNISLKMHPYLYVITNKKNRGHAKKNKRQYK